jgi:hypothetical protein
MKKFITLLLTSCCLFACCGAYAKVWRVNNNVGVSANFTDLPAAITGAAAGDTIYLEASATAYAASVVNKRLVIIGPGYFLRGIPNANPNTQVNPDTATMSQITCQAGSAGSVIEGLFVNVIILQDSMVTVQRNFIGSFIELGSSGTNNALNHDTIRQNYFSQITAGISTVTVSSLMVYNNIITTGMNLSNIASNANGYIINNNVGSQSVASASFSCANFVFQNNILYNPQFSTFLNSNVYFNNISTSNVIPAGNGNVNNVTFSTLFLSGVNTGQVQGGAQVHTQDSAWMLAAASPAIGAGALNGSPVDCGAFGGPAPYVLSGMSPGIPSIYALTAPTQVNSGTASINVTVSAASH